jgi:hypothetical protein
MSLLNKIAGLGVHRQRFWRATGCQMLFVKDSVVRIYGKQFRYDLELSADQIELTDCRFVTLLIHETLKRRGLL